MMRSRRTGVSVFAVYWSIAVTIVNVRGVCWFTNERSQCFLLIVLRVCALTCRCVDVVYPCGVRGCFV